MGTEERIGESTLKEVLDFYRGKAAAFGLQMTADQKTHRPDVTYRAECRFPVSDGTIRAWVEVTPQPDRINVARMRCGLVAARGGPDTYPLPEMADDIYGQLGLRLRVLELSQEERARGVLVMTYDLSHLL